MTDYNKLTVVKLKAELKQRGLPNSGLKPALIARLTEADAQSEGEVPASTDDPEAENGSVNATTGIDAASELNGTDDHGGQVVNGEASDIERKTETNPASNLQGPSEESIHDDDAAKNTAPEFNDRSGAKQNDAAPEPSEVSGTFITTADEAPIASSEPLEVPAVAVLGAEVVQTVVPTPQVSVEPEGPPENKSPDTEMIILQEAGTEPESPLRSTQTSYSKEIVEDTRKRKRRSQTPPPSSIDGAFKKAKALDGSPRVILPEDVDPNATAEDYAMASTGFATQEAEEETHGEAASGELPSLDIDGRVTLSNEKTVPTTEDDLANDQHKASPYPIDHPPVELPTDTILSPSKTSPTDTRFKNLFSAPAKQSSPPRHDKYLDTEDRIISPAIHPATSALYIRNFMRPLQPGQLKDHLTALAKPANASPTEESISDFFLDAIRTHCLVRFSNVSAASRVRSALHDRVWPDERTRKSLWVDFVPEEKLKKWIDVEQSAASSRGQPAKRWEVVYEKEGESIVAYLQESDGGNGVVRGGVSSLAREDAGRGVQGAPSGPRGSDVRPQTRPGPNVDAGRGFKALDDLFKGTVAKPKLYWLSAPKSVVDRRLDRLAAGRGGGRSDEMRRYTFEEEVLVDKGPEFGYGRGGGHRGRGGGYSGGNVDRSGGYRGDSWRGRR